MDRATGFYPVCRGFESFLTDQLIIIMSYAAFYKIEKSQILYHDYLIKKYCGVVGFKCKEGGHFIASANFRSTSVMLNFLKELEEYKQANVFETINILLKALLNK